MSCRCSFSLYLWYSPQPTKFQYPNPLSRSYIAPTYFYASGSLTYRSSGGDPAGDGGLNPHPNIRSHTSTYTDAYSCSYLYPSSNTYTYANPDPSAPLLRYLEQFYLCRLA